MDFLRLVVAHLLLYIVVLFGWMVPQESIRENLIQFFAAYIAGFIIAASLAAIAYTGYWIFT